MQRPQWEEADCLGAKAALDEVLAALVVCIMVMVSFSMFNFAMWSFMFFWDVEFASYYAVSSCFCDLV